MEKGVQLLDVTVSGASLEQAAAVLVLIHAPEGAREVSEFADEMLAALKGAASFVAVALPSSLDISDTGSEVPRSLVRRVVATVRSSLAACSSPCSLVLGGFSCAALVAAHALVDLRAVEGLDRMALLLISGRLDAPTLCRSADTAQGGHAEREQLSVFLVHGEDDEVIPEQAIHRGITAVREGEGKTLCGISLQAFFHEGGHEIGDGTAGAVAEWLGSKFSLVRSCPPQAQAPPAALSSSKAVSQVEARTGSGSEEAQAFRAGDLVRLRGLQRAKHLNGARGVLEAWDEDSQTWEVELSSTRDHVFVSPSRLELYVPEQERPHSSVADCRRVQVPASSELAELKAARIPPIFDAPPIQRLLWGEQPRVGVPGEDALPSDSELVSLGGVRCLVFGRNSPAHLAAPTGVPTALLFRGRGSGGAGQVAARMAPLARAYASCLAGLAVVPIAALKTSEIYPQARAVANALPRALATGPMVVHGVFTGSFPAVQIAAEHSQQECAPPRCRLLVLESGISSIDQIPGITGVIGGMQNDPFMQEAKLRMVRCEIALVRGAEHNSLLKLRADPLDAMAGTCPSAPIILGGESALVEGTEKLLPELRQAIVEALPAARS